jgi:hypothetical protein
VIEVSHDHGEWSVVAERAAKLDAEAVEEGAAVGESGEGVGGGEQLELPGEFSERRRRTYEAALAKERGADH